jgi:VWFA-related protein
MTTDELPLAQKAANGLLDRPLADDDDAAVVTFMGGNSGITHDHAALQAAIAKLSVHHVLQHDREDCPDVDYYSADQIVHQHNATEFQIAVEKAKQCSSLQVELSHEDPYTGMSNPYDPFQRAAMAAASRALATGEEDARESLATVQNVVRAMSKLPGERVLILVSSGFLSLSPETMKMKSEIMDLAAASDVTVNALDARGLYVGNLDASHGGSTSTIALVTGQEGQNHLASMQASENAMSELAVGTGGRFFHNNNDLLGGLEMLAAVPENEYLLEISLKDVKANGAFHRLQVKLHNPGLEVLARKGYVAPKAAGGKNDRVGGSQKR